MTTDHIKITHAEQGIPGYLILCERCGISSKIHLPISVDEFRAKIKRFYEDHRECSERERVAE